MRIFISILSLFLIYSCNCENRHKESITPKICKNKTDLLSSFNEIASFDKQISDLRLNFEGFINENFDSNYCCKDLRFNINHYYYDTIKLSTNTWYDCGNCPIAIRETNLCVVLINGNNQILFENGLINLSQLDSGIYNYYNLTGKDDTYPNQLNKVRIHIQWDLQTDPKFLQSSINKILDGYLQFIMQWLQENGLGEICDLNSKDLRILYSNVPLNLYINLLKPVAPDIPELD